jgi:hypothetical protein
VNRLRRATLLVAFALAIPAAGADPAKGARPVKVPEEEGALDAAPAPGSTARPGSTPVAKPAAERDRAKAGPPAAHSGAWRAGARPPAEEVPAAAMVRAAKRSEGEGGKARRRSAVPEPDGSRVVEIIWYAPGSTD